MRSLFQMGFHRDFFWLAAEPPLTKEEHDTMLTKVREGIARLSAVKAWQGATPDWEASLGNDATAFKDAMARAEPLTPGVMTIQEVLLKNDRKDWTVTTPQSNDVDAWSIFVDELDGYVQKHKGKEKPAGTAAAGQAGGGGTSPLVYAGVAAVVVIAVIAIT